MTVTDRQISFFSWADLSVFSWMISYLLDTVPAASETMFQLPVLQGSPYSLDDVLILPRGGEQINVTLTFVDNSIAAETFTLTYEDEFRINNKSYYNNFTIENGILMTTSENATVIVSFRTWQLQIHSTDMCSEHYVFEQSNQRYNYHDFVHIQPLQGHTFANICITDIPGYKDELDNLDVLSGGSNAVFTNCTQVGAMYPDGLILKNVSSFHRLEINTNQVVCVFQGYISNSFYQPTILENYNSSLTTMQPIKWSYVPTVRERSNQFLLIPQLGGRETILYILSKVNTTLSIFTDRNVTQHFIAADESLSINIDIDDEHVTLLSSDSDITVSCSYNSVDEDLCQLIPLKELYNLNVQNSPWSLNYTWIYYTVDTLITILCQDSVEYVLTRGDTSVDTNETRTFVVSGQRYQVVFVYDVIPGLYKMSLDCSINRCAVIYSNWKNYQSDVVNNDKNKYKLRNANETSNTTNAKNLTFSANFIDDFINISTLANTDWTTSTETHELDTTSINTTMPPFGNASIDTNDTTAQTESPEQNESATEHEGNKDQNVNIHVKPQKGDVNERFRVVVDIVQSKDGQVNILPSSKDSETPKYLYTDEYSGYMGVSDNKSFTAIFSSLGAALLAVIILILGFLLKEVFSRRQQRRNTRIRPFVSYY